MTRIIAVEEHFSTIEHVDILLAIIEKSYPIPEVVEAGKTLWRELPWVSPSQSADKSQVQVRRQQLLDIGEGRIQAMDRDGIDVQLLSLAVPGVQVLDAPAAGSLAIRINDDLAAAVSVYPDRLAGLATIAPQDPTGAANELRRAVTGLGMKGVCINSHTDGEYLDEKKFWPILEAANDLDAPIYIHARAPSPDMIKPYLVYPGLSSAILGYSAEVSLHAMRLILSGVFDTFPNLKIILGHLGEALPYWMWRMDRQWQRRTGNATLKKKPSDYLKENFYITTSGMNWLPALVCAHMSLGADRILFAVDYPFESNREAVDFIAGAPIAGSDKEKLLHLNAEKLLHL